MAGCTGGNGSRSTAIAANVATATAFAGQELAKPQHVGELGGREPALLLDHHAPRPREHPAEPAYADGQKAEEQARQRRRGWRIRHSGWILCALP
jgi:hypothetical protein